MAEVTVIIPTFNRADLVGRAIQSVLNQSMQDWECVVVDDGSSDNTREVVLGYPDSRIRYMYQENQKLPTARNNGVRAGSAPFLAFLDSDDLFLPHKLAAQLEAFHSDPELGMVLSGWADVDIHGNRIRQVSPWQVNGSLKLDDWLTTCPAPPPAVMVRREWFDRLGGFDPLQHFVEDWDMWLRLSYAGCKMAWVPQLVCLKTTHGKSMIRNVQGMSSGLFRLMEKFFSQPGLPPHLTSRRGEVFSRVHLDSAGRALGAGEVEMARDFLRQALRLNSALAEGNPPLILQSLASTALTDVVPDQEVYLAAWQNALSGLPQGLARSPRQLKALIWAVTAFDLTNKQVTSEARKFAAKALYYDPGWLTNRGLLKILLTF